MSDMFILHSNESNKEYLCLIFLKKEEKSQYQEE